MIDSVSRSFDVQIINLAERKRTGSAALNMAPDDYVVIPYSPEEMIARAQAILRRSHLGTDEAIVEYSDIRLDLAQHRISR